jgi:hypothetical protein
MQITVQPRYLLKCDKDYKDQVDIEFDVCMTANWIFDIVRRPPGMGRNEYQLTLEFVICKCLESSDLY